MYWNEEKRLKDHKYANAKVIIVHDEEVNEKFRAPNSDIVAYILFSYTTLVAEIRYTDTPEGKEAVLSVFGLYSATTRKHISYFMREYTPFDYHTAKNAYLKGVSVRWKI